MRRLRKWVESFPTWAEEVSSWNEQRLPSLCKSVYYFVLLIISKVGLGLYFLEIYVALRITLCLWFLGTLLLSTLLADVIAMVIEFPVASLMKIWQSREERPPMTTNIIDRTPLVGEADA